MLGGVVMAITNGRGDENKIRILSQYGLRPVMHSVLLNGQCITCCCGLPVTDRFYQFDVVNPVSGRVVDILYAGEECAGRFLLLSRSSSSSPIPPLALFDPLQGAAETGYGAQGAGLPKNGAPMAPINAEVEQAICLTLMCYGRLPVPEGAFSILLRKIRANPDRPLLDWEIRTVNTKIGNEGHTLTAMLANLREANQSLKQYAVPEMAAALRREAASSGLRIHSYL
jgi:hypothetical protein